MKWYDVDQQSFCFGDSIEIICVIAFWTINAKPLFPAEFLPGIGINGIRSLL